jgi:endoglucanase
MCCEEGKIAYQREVVDRGGNFSSSMHLSSFGVRSGGIVVMTRYPHSQSAVASKKDIEAGIDLLNAFSQFHFQF